MVGWHESWDALQLNDIEMAMLGWPDPALGKNGEPAAKQLIMQCRNNLCDKEEQCNELQATPP